MDDGSQGLSHPATGQMQTLLLAIGRPWHISGQPSCRWRMVLMELLLVLQCRVMDQLTILFTLLHNCVTIPIYIPTNSHKFSELSLEMCRS